MPYYSESKLKKKNYKSLVSIAETMDIDTDKYSEDDTKDLIKKIMKKQEKAVVEDLLENSTKKLKSMMKKLGFEEDEVDDIEDTDKNRKKMAKTIFKAKYKDSEEDEEDEEEEEDKKSKKSKKSKSSSRRKASSKKDEEEPKRSRSVSKSRSRSRSRSPEKAGVDYASMNITALKEVAKKMGISGYGKFRAADKDALVALIKKEAKAPSPAPKRSPSPPKRTSPRSMDEYDSMSLSRLKDLGKVLGVPSTYKYTAATKGELLKLIKQKKQRKPSPVVEKPVGFAEEKKPMREVCNYVYVRGRLAGQNCNAKCTVRVGNKCYCDLHKPVDSTLYTDIKSDIVMEEPAIEEEVIIAPPRVSPVRSPRVSPARIPRVSPVKVFKRIEMLEEDEEAPARPSNPFVEHYLITQKLEDLHKLAYEYNIVIPDSVKTKKAVIAFLMAEGPSNLGAKKQDIIPSPEVPIEEVKAEAAISPVIDEDVPAIGSPKKSPEPEVVIEEEEVQGMDVEDIKELIDRIQEMDEEEIPLTELSTAQERIMKCLGLIY